MMTEPEGPDGPADDALLILQIGCFGSLGNVVFSMKNRALPLHRNFD
jgi:hypothetical protein